MSARDLDALRRDWQSLRDYAILGIDSMNAVERDTLHEAMERLEARFVRFDQEAAAFRNEVTHDIQTIRDDMSRIKGMAKLVTVVLTIGIPAAIGVAGLVLR